MRIVIVTPAAAGSRQGNRRTASRWARLLRSQGHRVDVATVWTHGDQDVMIALHARKSRPSLLAYKSAHPDHPLILALTGTDIYRDIRIDANAAASLAVADRLVVLQQAALEELSAAQRAKTRVIHQSEPCGGPWQPPKRWVRFCMLGHLRQEKNPFLAVSALRHLDEARLRLVLAGGEMEPGYGAQAQRLMERETRFRWVGNLPHGRAMQLLRHSHALIVGSGLEGGAHVVTEAVVHGVPVIASDIPGNRGLLGDDYPGYFPAGDELALAALMRRAASDAGFLLGLAAAAAARQALFSVAGESAAWRALLDPFSPHAPALP